MQTEVKKINDYTRELSITVSADEKKEFDKLAFKKVRKTAEIPGFRKGKAPEALVKKQFAYTIANEMIDIAMEKLYPQAIKELDLPVVAPGQFKDVKNNDKDELVLVFDVVVEPDVELKKVKGLKVSKKIIPVTQKNIDAVVEEFREKHAVVQQLEEGAAVGNFIVFDMSETDADGNPLPGKKYENITVQLGDGKFEKDIEEQLIGCKIGEKRNILKEFPEDYEQEELRGKKEYYLVEVKDVYSKELPKVDDEFASTVNENYKTVDDMLKDIKEKSEFHAEQQMKADLRKELINKIVEENPVEVPKEMVENYLNRLIEDLKAQYNDHSLDNEKWREIYRESAEKNVKWFVVRNKIAETENIEVSEEDVDAKIDGLEGVTDEVKKQIKGIPYYRDNIKEEILEERVLTWLEENAEIEVVEPEKEAKKKTSAKKGTKKATTKTAAKKKADNSKETKKKSATAKKTAAKKTTKKEEKQK